MRGLLETENFGEVLLQRTTSSIFLRIFRVNTSLKYFSFIWFLWPLWNFFFLWNNVCYVMKEVNEWLLLLGIFSFVAKILLWILPWNEIFRAQTAIKYIRMTFVNLWKNIKCIFKIRDILQDEKCSVYINWFKKSWITDREDNMPSNHTHMWYKTQKLEAIFSIILSI